jgi:hypothetical protein
MTENLVDIVGQIKKIETSKWHFEDHEEEVAERVRELAFEGELVKNDLFISMPVSAVDPRTKISESLSTDEVNEYIETGDISSKNNWTIDMWLTVRFDLDRDYVRIYETPYVSFELSPKENYEIAYTRIKEFMTASNAKVQKLPHIFELDLDDYDYADDWKALKIATTWLNKNPSVHSDLNDRVRFDKQKFFSDMNRRVKDDQWEASNPKQRIKIPTNYTTVQLDRAAVNTLKGTKYESLYFPAATEKYFDNRDDLLNYFWSAVEWVNEHLTYQFHLIDKINTSNMWPNEYEEKTGVYSPPIDPGETKYFFHCTNVQGVPILEAEVWENGTVYTLKNHEKGDPIYYDRVSDGR